MQPTCSIWNSRFSRFFLKLWTQLGKAKLLEFKKIWTKYDDILSTFVASGDGREIYRESLKINDPDLYSVNSLAITNF